MQGEAQEPLAKRFREPSDPFQKLIVRDMWLTGFDAPSLHTMTVDEPTRGHGLMQAIARVNRVFRDKPGGLVVDYLGLAPEHVLAQEDAKECWLATVHELSLAFALAIPHEEAIRIRDDVGFFHAVRACLAKRAPGDAKCEEELDPAARLSAGQAGEDDPDGARAGGGAGAGVGGGAGGVVGSPEGLRGIR